MSAPENRGLTALSLFQPCPVVGREPQPQGIAPLGLLGFRGGGFGQIPVSPRGPDISSVKALCRGGRVAG
jgi:hypothetical protein